MIIVCNSCSAQYSVADAKVRGKLVRITCKHCATAIVVDGRSMSDAAIASQQPLPSYPLPRRDESVVAHAPVRSALPGAAQSALPSAVHSALPAPMQSVMSASVCEDDRTMIARSKFGHDMSVHEERTVIGQIPAEALELERMLAQRTQPPPPDAPASAADASLSAAEAPASAAETSLSAAEAPASAAEASLSAAEAPASAAETSLSAAEAPASAAGALPSAVAAPSAPPPRSSVEEPLPSVLPPKRPARAVDEAERATSRDLSRSDPPSLDAKPTSDARGLVSLAEATQPSVARTVTARRLRVTVITLLVLAVLVLLFVIQMPR